MAHQNSIVGFSTQKQETNLMGFHGISTDFHHFPRSKRSPVDLGDLPAAQRPSALQGVLARREAEAREAREARHEAARAQVEAQEEVPCREMSHVGHGKCIY